MNYLAYLISFELILDWVQMWANASFLTDDTQVSLHANDVAVPHGSGWEGCQACFEISSMVEIKGQKHQARHTERKTDVLIYFDFFFVFVFSLT